MKSLIKNLLLVIISILLVLFLAEVSLYLSGKIYYIYRVKNTIRQAEDKNTIKILCLGDSNTFGMGADKGYSYPEQLERMLKESNQDKKFVVYNAGMPGNTSSKLLIHLEENLQKYNPDILIVLIGANDAGQIKETNYFLFKNAGLKGFIYKLEYHLGRFRVYRLFKRGWDVLMINLWEKRLIAKYNNYFMLLKPKKPQSLIVDRKTTDEFNRHIEAGSGYWNEYNRKTSLAIGEFKKAIAIMPNNTDGYHGLAEVYGSSGELDLAIETLEKAIRIDPYNPDIFFSLYQMYYRSENSRLAQDALEKYLYFNPTEILTYLPFLSYGLPLINDQATFIKLLKYNLNGIINIAKSRKIKLILQNYSDPLENDSQLQSILGEVALKNKITFVNNRLIFQKLKLREGYKYTDYFNEDTHCNNKGYFIMAESVYKVMIHDGRLP